VLQGAVQKPVGEPLQVLVLCPVVAKMSLNGAEMIRACMGMGLIGHYDLWIHVALACHICDRLGWGITDIY
jgi:hypothetical protein